MFIILGLSINNFTNCAQFLSGKRLSRLSSSQNQLETLHSIYISIGWKKCETLSWLITNPRLFNRVAMFPKMGGISVYSNYVPKNPAQTDNQCNMKCYLNLETQMRQWYCNDCLVP